MQCPVLSCLLCYWITKKGLRCEVNAYNNACMCFFFQEQDCVLILYSKWAVRTGGHQRALHDLAATLPHGSKQRPHVVRYLVRALRLFPYAFILYQTSYLLVFIDMSWSVCRLTRLLYFFISTSLVAQCNPYFKTPLTKIKQNGLERGMVLRERVVDMEGGIKKKVFSHWGGGCFSSGWWWWWWGRGVIWGWGLFFIRVWRW